MNPPGASLSYPTAKTCGSVLERCIRAFLLLREGEPPFEFENWAVIALGGIKNSAQVGDMGIDGRIFPVSSLPVQKKPPASETFSFMDQYYPMQVKQKDKAGRPDIDQFETALLRAGQKKGFFISFAYTSDALTEIDRFFRKTGNVIVPLTVSEILNEEIAHKIA